MKFFYLLCFILISQYGAAQAIDEKYLLDAVRIMKENSVNKGKINWEQFTSDAMAMVGDDTSKEELYSVISKCVEKLGDQHSGFYPPDMVKAYLKSYKESGLNFPEPKDSLLEGDIAYISLPAIGNLNQNDWKIYVSAFSKKARFLDSKKPKAWIIDLRKNDGGMFAPMLKAIIPFLDRKNVVGSKDNTGKVNYYSTKGNNIFFGSTLIGTIEVPEIKLKSASAPVFVLVSKKTASSGEFITAAFKGQKNVLVVGTNTQGLTSDNSEFRLSDGAILKLTTGTMIDRRGEVYAEIGKGITPDVPTDSSSLEDYLRAIEEKLQ